MARSLACHGMHAVWRASEGRTRDSVRGDARRCGSREVERLPSRIVAKILKCSKMYFQGITTCDDEIINCTCLIFGVTHFVNSL